MDDPPPRLTRGPFVRENFDTCVYEVLTISRET